jgi:anti-sigma factor RsiW
MPPTPDVRPTSHDRHDPLLVAALASGDLAATHRVHATQLIETCPDCATLHDDLVAIARATANVPPPITTRPRDFRLSREQAARLRPSGWRRVIAAFGSPQLAFTKPLGVGLATIGLAGLLLANVSLGSLGAMSAAAPMSATGASAGSAESNQSGGTRGLGDAAGAASVAPASAAPVALGPVGASPAASGTGGFYPVALPSPSSAPAPSLTTDRSASGLDRCPCASNAEVAGGPKTSTPGASQPTRDLVSETGQPLEQTADEATPPDLRTMIFVAAVLVGLGLLVLRRVARSVTAA